jgi:hypothetical protein
VISNQTIYSPKPRSCLLKRHFCELKFGNPN